MPFERIIMTIFVSLSAMSLIACGHESKKTPGSVAKSPLPPGMTKKILENANLKNLDCSNNDVAFYSNLSFAVLSETHHGILTFDHLESFSLEKPHLTAEGVVLNYSTQIATIDSDGNYGEVVRKSSTVVDGQVDGVANSRDLNNTGLNLLVNSKKEISEAHSRDGSPLAGDKLDNYLGIKIPFGDNYIKWEDRASRNRSGGLFSSESMYLKHKFSSYETVLLPKDLKDKKNWLDKLQVYNYLENEVGLLLPVVERVQSTIYGKNVLSPKATSPFIISTDGKEVSYLHLFYLKEITPGKFILKLNYRYLDNENQKGRPGINQKHIEMNVNIEKSISENNYGDVHVELFSKNIKVGNKSLVISVAKVSDKGSSESTLSAHVQGVGQDSVFHHVGADFRTLNMKSIADNFKSGVLCHWYGLNSATR